MRKYFWNVSRSYIYANSSTFYAKLYKSDISFKSFNFLLLEGQLQIHNVCKFNALYEKLLTIWSKYVQNCTSNTLEIYLLEIEISVGESTDKSVAKIWFFCLRTKTSTLSWLKLFKTELATFTASWKQAVCHERESNKPISELW